MSRVPKRAVWISAAIGGPLFGILVFVMIQTVYTTPSPLWFSLVAAVSGGVVFGVAMGVVAYFGAFTPRWWWNNPPPPGFADRRVTFRDRMLGDGRPFPASAIRSTYLSGFVLTGLGAAVTVLAVAAGTVWPTLAAGILMLALGVGNVAIARHRSVPRPPYSTWLEQQADHDDVEAPR